MGLVSNGAGGDVRLPMIDQVDSVNGWDTAGLANPKFCQLPSTVPLSVVGPVWALVGGATTFFFDTATQNQMNSFVSAGGSRTVRLGPATMGVPVGRSNNPMIAGNKSALIRPLMRYTFIGSVVANPRGTARYEWGLAESNGVMSLLGTGAAAVWTSDPALNGGLLTPQHRLVNGGAIVTGPSSGVVYGAANWVTLGIRWTERLTGGLLEYLINDQVAFSVNAPVWGLATPGQIFMAMGASAVAGTTHFYGPHRFTVEALG